MIKKERYEIVYPEMTFEHRNNIRKANRGKSLFGFTGAQYSEKEKNPWNKVWKASVKINGKSRYLGIFHDPLTCEILHDFVVEELQRLGM